GRDRYAAGTAIWAKSDHAPRAIVHCQTAEDVQAAIHAARSCDLPLSVRGGGHDWQGRALCNGLVIDLSGRCSSPSPHALGKRELRRGRLRTNRALDPQTVWEYSCLASVLYKPTCT